MKLKVTILILQVTVSYIAILRVLNLITHLLYSDESSFSRRNNCCTTGSLTSLRP